ncbi:alpha-amylase [Rickenella mellea]|uniref:alpha-amylase n=1 Tax=Rickenella mellea TaxID=50990 RepID=A0A4Y7QHU7_9AGAM|nr:alpha-amylase [Rickenella mellea]
MHIFILVLICGLIYLQSASAATAEQWRGRSIYQIITDRYALPAGSNSNVCDPGDQTWCGGTWNSIRENLDYIQNAGFTAIWISPVSQNYEGPRTPYGDAYHGYWIADVSKLNDRFGTSDDLKGLSDELHRRGMYLMVDVVVNNVMALSTTPDFTSYLFKDPTQYHPYCSIQWGNVTSEQNCWLGDTNVTLPDVNTQDGTVQASYGLWIQSLVQTYNIDGLRIDGTHVNTDFWPVFCENAGVFCIGEVFGSDMDQAASYQGPQALDSILHYPMYGALTNAFAIPGPQNMSAMVDVITQSKRKFVDPGLLGNFVENQDLPRWANLSVDIQSLWNVMTFNFMFDGIPIVYYGQEQGFSGNADPWNREPLWPSNYANTSTYALISTLNQAGGPPLLRNFLGSSSNWLKSETQILTATTKGIALSKGNVITVLTNIGSPVRHLQILTCTQFIVGSNGTIEMQYSKGGAAAVFVPSTALNGSGLCGFPGSNQTKSARSSVSSHGTRIYTNGIYTYSLAASVVLFWLDSCKVE